MRGLLRSLWWWLRGRPALVGECLFVGAPCDICGAGRYQRCDEGRHS